MSESTVTLLVGVAAVAALAFGMTQMAKAMQPKPAARKRGDFERLGLAADEVKGVLEGWFD